MISITMLGDRLLAFGIWFVCFLSEKANVRKTARILFVSLIASVAVVEVLKHMIDRPRPCEVLSGVVWLGNVRVGFSFPSAHTAVSFVLASVFGSAYKRFATALFILATSVGISRVYLGVHYPSDVIGGALIGVAFSYATGKILDKFNRI